MKESFIQIDKRRSLNLVCPRLHWASWASWAFPLALLISNAITGLSADPIPALYKKAGIFEDAISNGKFDFLHKRQVTGITVPHHLLAPDLISLGFHAASSGDYERIILLAPDHFRKTLKPFATTTRDFQTALGDVSTDSNAVGNLCKRCDLVEKSELFSREHGVQAILPFIARFFPRAKVIPLVIRNDSNEAEWRDLVDALKPLVTEQTLIIQSTDFSHYLPGPVANQRDQETMNIIASGSLEQLSRLQQPQHLDALAAQWIHQAIQAEVFGAGSAIIAHRNSNQYTSSPQRETTSYLVQVFEKNAAGKPPWPTREGDSFFFFAGDTFLGRNFAPLASHSAFAAKVQKRILHLTQGAPLFLNLEGVLSAKIPDQGEKKLLLMPDTLTLDWLKKLNVVGVSLANNHAHDQGGSGWYRTRDALEKNGIVVVGDRETRDFGPFLLAAYTDLSNHMPPYTQRLNRENILSTLPTERTKPLFCFPHWGLEWEMQPGPREEQLTGFFLEGGASVLLGAHPHTISKRVEALRGGRCARVYSMGNFLFDQRSPEASGAIVEARFFSTGTYALRWIPIGNFFEMKIP